MRTQPKRTVTGTNIDEVKKLNRQSGFTYNEAKIILAKKMGLLKEN